MAALLFFFVLGLSEGFVGAMFHAQGLFFPSALVTGFVDGPADDARLGIAENPDAAPLRPETPRVVKRADQLADLTSVTESRPARNSSHS
jgi:hypothetical protein